MLPITDEITVLSLLHPCTPCTLVEINEVKCIRQGAHKSNRISSSLCSHNIGLSLKYIYMNMSVKCYLCTYIVYHITCMLGDNKDIVNWIKPVCHNSLAPRRYASNSKDVVFKLILQVDIMSISWTIAFMWMSQNPLMIRHFFQLMDWCHQATHHYLCQCWPRSMSSYDGITWSQSVNIKSDIYWRPWR